MKILGIDPGLNITGLGIIEAQKMLLTYKFSGCIRTHGDEHYKIVSIFSELSKMLCEQPVDVVVVERIFMRPDRPNPESTIKLAQARGAIISAIGQQGIPIIEYSANQIKKTVVGRGHAQKAQVSFMVKHLLKLTKKPQPDVADALAGAICHAYHSL